MRKRPTIKLDFEQLEERKLPTTVVPITSTDAIFYGEVYEDLDADGVFDSGESTVGDYSVESRNVTENAPATHGGLYQGSDFFNFSYLTPLTDTFQGRIIPDVGWFLSPGNTDVDSDGYTEEFTFDYDPMGPDEMFEVYVGIYQPGTISGTVFSDLDANGIYHPLPPGTPDPGAAGVVVALLDENGDPVLDENDDPVTAVSGSDGSYSFEDLIPGTYQVSFSAPSGWQWTLADQGTNDGLDSDVDEEGLATGVVVTSGGTTDIDAGLRTGSLVSVATPPVGSGAGSMPITVGGYGVSLADGNLHVEDATAHAANGFEQAPVYYYAGLVYNSSTARPKPVVGVYVDTESGMPTLEEIKVRLTWGTTTQSWVTLTPPEGYSAGDPLYVTLPVTTEVDSTDLYFWQVDVQFDYDGAPSLTGSYAGSKVVVVNDTTWGQGWSQPDANYLKPVADGSLILVQGDGGYRYFQYESGSFKAPFQYESLVAITGGYQYFDAQTKLTWTYTTASGGNYLLTKVSDPKNVTVTYTYSSGVLTQVTNPNSNYVSRAKLVSHAWPNSGCRDLERLKACLANSCAFWRSAKFVG